MTNQANKTSYGDAIRAGFEYAMNRDPKCFAIGQGLWSPWYVGSSMTNLEKQFGKERVIDTPISELATTGAAMGAALHGYSPIVVHPRMDFMILAADQIVNQAAKWRHMFGGRVSPAIVFRSIINRGGEQGAQHSQALHAWYAHIPGLRVLMPATPIDARDMLIAAAQSPDPVMYIDDRWCYDMIDELPPAADINICEIVPRVLRSGTDITIAASGFSVSLALQAANNLSDYGINVEIVDVRQINPLDEKPVIDSVRKTGRLLVIDGGWKTCGLAGEIIARVIENLNPNQLKVSSARITLPDAPAPTSSALESIYYVNAKAIYEKVLKMVDKDNG